MHFSIPDTKECKDDSGSTYVTYNIQVNGWPHCSLRYRQLHSLHQLLQQELPTTSLPFFPPKKMLPLSQSQAEERRQALEKYILTLSQEPRVLQCPAFNAFLAAGQHESYTGGGAVEAVPVHVNLMNGQRVTVQGTDAMQTRHVLQLVCKQIGLPLELMNYFALFLVRKKDNQLILVKKLQHFECPYISQKSLRGSHKIMLRKNYWVWPQHKGAEVRATSHPVGLGLVYGQVVAEMQHGWLSVTPQQQQQLGQLQARGCKGEYLEVARGLPQYGCVLFAPCVCDFPQPGTPVTVMAGNNELCFRIVSDDGVVKEGNFKVTRMRCWRISTHQTADPKQRASSEPCSSKEPNRQNSSTSTSSSGFSSSHSISDGSINNASVDPEAGGSGCAGSPTSFGRRLACGSNNGGYVVGGSVGGDVTRVDSFAASIHNTRKGSSSSTTSIINNATTGSASTSDGAVNSVSFVGKTSVCEEGTVLELSFEYLLRAGELRWVRVLSSQAVLMSLCLQSMVHQLLQAEAGDTDPPAAPPVTDGPVMFARKDGTTVAVCTHTTQQPRSNSGGLSALGELSLRRLSERLSELSSSQAPPQLTSSDAVVPGSSGSQQYQSSPHLVENTAFNTITDQHL